MLRRARGALSVLALLATAGLVDAGPEVRPSTAAAPAASAFRDAAAGTVRIDSGEEGLSVLVQDAAGAWTAVARLSEPRFETDRWIGQACVTGSGERAVVAYAPAHFANRAELFDQGAFLAVVELATGQVTKLPHTATLAYHSPGCGEGEEVAVTQRRSQHDQRTRVLVIDTRTARVTWSRVFPEQLTSVVPVGASRVVGARGGSVVEASGSGRVAVLSKAPGTPYDLAVEDGIVEFSRDRATMDPRFEIGADHHARRVAEPRALQRLVTSAEGGAVAGSLPTVDPAAFAAGARTSPALAAPDPSPVDPEATCAVPRNDARTQVYQPNPRQVEWAVSQAVQDNLRMQRPANWKKSGLPSYRPQSLFPPVMLRGGGRIPAQVVLGVLAQESNLWQASGHAIEGWAGNPLIGDYYGRGGTWTIDWNDADCGYGMGQLTVHMRTSDTVWSATQKRAVAMDYAANVAAVVQHLGEKWNQLHDAGLLVNNGDPRHIENWFAAVWIYNSGWHPPGESPSGTYGLGWSNNPANPDYPPSRLPFLDADNYADAAHPQDWPYPEKVMGWAAWPIANPRLGAAYRAAWWNTPSDRSTVKPPRGTFCGAENLCSTTTTAACSRSDYHCWWHSSVRWKQCPQECGNGLTRFDTTYPEQPDSTPIAATCSTAGLPAGTVVVDSVPSDLPMPSACASPPATSGSFSFSVNQNAAKIDLHQVGLGFNGHSWFAHGRVASPENAWSLVRGTWSAGRALSGWHRVLVHVPARAASSQQAAYVIDTGGGTPATAKVVVNTSGDRNRWISLGAFRLGTGVPKVTLSTTIATKTNDEIQGDPDPAKSHWDGRQNVAWDAVAFVPGRPTYRVAVLGDSFTSGEGATVNGPGDYLSDTDHDGAVPAQRNNCHRSSRAWWTQVVVPGSQQNLGQLAASYSPRADVAFVACSGAKTFNIWPASEGGMGQEGEVPQLDSGVVNANTTHVVLTIGGNDAGFGPVLRNCIALPACMDFDDVPAASDIVAAQEDIEKTLRLIHAKAPSARIYLGSYPLLVALDTYCLDGIDEAETRWIREMGALMVTQTQATVVALRNEGLPVTFVDPTINFSGREICTSTPFLHGIIREKTPGEVRLPESANPTSQQSFHPNANGAKAYARAFEGQLVWD